MPIFILDSTDASEWRYVPTSDIPVDDQTRGYTATQMNVNSRWIQGPPFLPQSEHFWPARPKSSQQVAVSFTHQPTDEYEKPLFEKTRFSDWHHLVRTIAFCFLVADKARNRHATSTLEHNTQPFKLLIKFSQQHTFRGEKKELTKKNCLPANSRIPQLSHFIDKHGLFQSRGRFAKDTVILCSRFPVILDAACLSIELFSQHIHNTNGHCGLKFNRALVQQPVWILKLPRYCNNSFDVASLAADNSRMLSSLSWLNCRNKRLPSSIIFPFRTTGVDYQGKFFIEAPRVEKRYILLFTWLLTIHIEINAKLNTDDSFLAIRRFLCRRGQPTPSTLTTQLYSSLPMKTSKPNKKT